MRCRVIKRADGVSVIHPAPKSKRLKETEEQWLKRVFDKATTGELEGQPFIDMDNTQLPSREDRNAWELVGGKVKVNQVKKQQLDDEKQAKIDTKDSAISKLKTLGLTSEEIESLKI